MASASITALIRKFASAHEGVEEGIACKGTKLEALTFTAHKKAFLFLQCNDGRYTLRLKLAGFLKEAAALAKKQPKLYEAGKGGWTKLTFAEDEAPPAELLKRWLADSYACTATKKK